uniref:Ubiquitin-like domain-containing protein n=1 Tax=Panagrolaimus davidi TaxID=227884 RepID=A0A914QG33_9BILA
MLSPSSSSTSRKRTYSQRSENDTTSISEKKFQHFLKDSKKIIIIFRSYMENANGFILAVDPLDSVKKVKELIEDKKYVLAFNYNLVFDGKQLEEDKPLSEFGIKNGSSVQLRPNASQYIQLPVLNNAGKTTVIKINVKETIEDLQVKIQNQTGIPLIQQRFTCFDVDQTQESLTVVKEREIPVVNVVAASSNQPKPEMITIVLGLLTDSKFRHIFKMKYTDRFDKVYLDYGAKAGYDKPEDLNLLWDDGSDFLNVKYFDTPQKLGMPANGTVYLSFNPKSGAKREKRKEGEIKIKLNTKGEKNPIERFIHKEMPFGEFKVKLCSELKVAASKVQFTFDGEKIADDDNPGDLDMEDFDCIDMHISK